MIRGTTPTHTFTLPMKAAEVKDLRITYAQNECVVLTKKLADCAMDGNTVAVTLTQKETLQFCAAYAVQLQLKVLTTSGAVLVSDIYNKLVGKCLNEEVLA